MDPEDHDWRPVFEKLTLLHRGWPAATWTWDPRFWTLTSSFGKELELAARASAAHALTYAWNATTIDTAPHGLQAICDRTGGLRPGQMLMAGKAGGVVLYGLWWPWGGGDTITLRLGIGECEVMEEPFPQVRHLFGVRL